MKYEDKGKCILQLHGHFIVNQIVMPSKCLDSTILTVLLYYPCWAQEDVVHTSFSW